MIYLFIGTDDYLKSDGAKRAIDELVPPEDRDFGLEIIDAACDKCEDVLRVLEQAEGALYTASFFGGKVVWLRDANFLPGAKGRAVEAQAAKDAVATFCEQLQNTPIPDGHHLIITAKSCLKTSRFAKWVTTKGVGTFVECGSDVRSYQLEKAGLERLANVLPASGLKMSAPVQSAFISRVGADTWTIVSELEKLRTYIGKADEVKLADVETITSAAAGAEPFDLANAILARSPLQVAKSVEQLRADKNAAFPAAAVILNTFNDLCAIRDALDQGWLAGNHWTIPHEQLPQRLTRLQGFMLGKQVEGAKRYTLNELRAARHYAIEMRFKMVDTSSQDPWAIIEPALLRMIARTPRR